MHQRPGLYIAETALRGRGVFASQTIPKGDIIEVCQIIKLPKLELPIIHKTYLHDYYFLWGENLDQAVIALGFGSLYNHAVYGNAEFLFDYEQETIDFIALTDILPGEEICVNYHGENGDVTPLWWEKVP